jgi:transcriptional regulator with XRE-family HTH domain
MLGTFLYGLRRRIAPETRNLGPYPRAASRRGKYVTQEELAEAIDVSRKWYCMLETGATSNVSARMLRRLAAALMLTREERMTLCFLMLPEPQSEDRSLPIAVGKSTT